MSVKAASHQGVDSCRGSLERKHSGNWVLHERPVQGRHQLTSADSLELVFVDFHTPETIKHHSEQRIATLLGNAITSGESLLNTTEEQNWGNDQDVQALRGEIGAAEPLISPGGR